MTLSRSVCRQTHYSFLISFGEIMSTGSEDIIFQLTELVLISLPFRKQLQKWETEKMARLL